jgi:hypothetical protein
LEEGREAVNWVDVTQNRAQWQGVVKIVYLTVKWQFIYHLCDDFLRNNLFCELLNYTLYTLAERVEKGLYKKHH